MNLVTCPAPDPASIKAVAMVLPVAEKNSAGSKVAGKYMRPRPPPRTIFPTKSNQNPLAAAPINHPSMANIDLARATNLGWIISVSLAAW